jgi:transcriptional regulator with XRE-family HTH domain
LTTGQLAAELGESEGALKLLEKGIVPSKSLNTINAIEQFLKIRLVKKDFLEQVRERNNKDEQAKNIIYRKSPIIENKDSNFIKQVQAKETQDMINQAINEEKNPNIQNLEKSEGYPFSASSFKKSEEKTGIRDILRMNEKIDSDFTKKSKEQVGKEQVDGFGKEDTSKIRRSVYRDRPSNKVPTIYELMKKKEEKDKTSIIGNDIDLAK